MWFVPGSHKEDPIRKHRPTKPGHHVLMTDDCSNVSYVPSSLVWWFVGICASMYLSTLQVQVWLLKTISFCGVFFTSREAAGHVMV